MTTSKGLLAIEASGLVKSFGAVRAVDGLDLAVPRGGVFALLGPNGAGKTTTIRIFATLAKPDSGKARVLGYDVTTSRRRRTRCAVGSASLGSSPRSTQALAEPRTSCCIRREPEQAFDAIAIPVLFTLLFTYLFGGALSWSSGWDC